MLCHAGNAQRCVTRNSSVSSCECDVYILKVRISTKTEYVPCLGPIQMLRSDHSSHNTACSCHACMHMKSFAHAAPLE